jgi:hypothetical protein
VSLFLLGARDLRGDFGVCRPSRVELSWNSLGTTEVVGCKHLLISPLTVGGKMDGNPDSCRMKDGCVSVQGLGSLRSDGLLDRERRQVALLAFA